MHGPQLAFKKSLGEVDAGNNLSEKGSGGAVESVWSLNSFGTGKTSRFSHVSALFFQLRLLSLTLIKQ